MLTIENLAIEFNKKLMLKEFNLTLEKGDIFALLGESGSGKSSVLRFIAGLENAANGKVILDGKELTSEGMHHVMPEQREIGMLFQDYALFPHMNVFQNISFGISHLSKSCKVKKVKYLLDLIYLEGIEKKYPYQLSGGEQQRVALARVLAISPKLLLLDEPFSNLDTNHRDQLIEQVRDILKAAFVTSILVTHDDIEVDVFADKFGEIKDKKLCIG